MNHKRLGEGKVVELARASPLIPTKSKVESSGWRKGGRSGCRGSGSLALTVRGATGTRLIVDIAGFTDQHQVGGRKGHLLQRNVGSNHLDACGGTNEAQMVAMCQHPVDGRLALCDEARHVLNE